MSVMIWMNSKTWMTTWMMTWMNLKILRNGNLNCVWTGAFLITSFTVTIVEPDLSLSSTEYCRYFSSASIYIFPNTLVSDCTSLLIPAASEFPAGIRVSRYHALLLRVIRFALYDYPSFSCILFSSRSFSFARLYAFGFAGILVTGFTPIQEPLFAV